MRSVNFERLRPAWPQLAELGASAEAYLLSDPTTATTKMRIFVEQLVTGLYHLLKLDRPPQARLVELLDAAEFQSTVPRVVRLKMDAIRVHGNKATHGGSVSRQLAQGLLKELFEVGRWLYLAHCGGKLDDLPEFQLPGPTTAEGETKASLKQEKRAALQRVAVQEAQLAALLETIAEAQEGRQVAEEEASELRKRLEARGAKTADELGFDEEATRRRLIDLQLTAAGWDVGPHGTSTDEVGQGVEVHHQPTPSGKGSADYVLWDDDGKPLAVIEAKRTAEDPSKGKMQAFHYANGFEQDHRRRPIILYTNGFDIWIWDDAQGYVPRKLYGFYSKDSLQQLIFQRGSRAALDTLSPNRTTVDRLYQFNAIKRVTEKFEQGHRKALIVMATGTGKTRVAIALEELLAEANWVKRALFLCDRRELRKQAKDAFTEFTSHSPVVVRTSTAKEREHRIYLATYPAMMKVFETFDPGFFDLIIADESHRSIYNVYRDIFDWFDGFQVGLTATPVEMVSRSTCRLFQCEFQQPDFNFPYEEAIHSSPPYLVPFELYTHTTKFLREGVHGDRLSDDQIAELEDQGVDPQALDVDAAEIDRAVHVTGTNDEVLKNLMENGIRQADGQTLGKTIMFARNHRHAVLLRDRFDRLYPQYGGKFCQVIDNYEPRADALIEDFKDWNSPLTIAISVDMLDTGIDVPEVVNLVFAKPVKSKVKFWQMIGRGTRLCPNLFGQGRHKSVFRIFDHWGNFEYFETSYQPVEFTNAKSLMQQVFEARLALAETALREAELDIFRATIADVRADILALPDDSIRVRERWREVRSARDPAALESWSPAVTALLRVDIAPLMQWRDIWGQADAYEFDLLILELQRLRITGGADFQDRAGEVRNLLASLPMRLSQVQAQAEIIKQAKEPAFWAPEKPSHEHLEKLRVGCRGLMRFIAESRAPAPAPRTLEVGDSEIEYHRRKSRIAEIDLAAYRANVLRALEELFETEPTLKKIRRGESVSESDLRTLTSLVLTQNPDVDLEVLREFYVVAEPLDKIIRSIIGMDPEAVQARFQDFVHAHPKITAKQTQFLQLLQNHIARHGTIELERLYEPPFTRIDTEGLDGVFADESLADELIDLLAQFERPPKSRAETTEPGEDA